MKPLNPGPVSDNWDWQVRAACRGMNVDLFYDPDFARGSAKRAHVAHAKAICANCPVIQQCLDRAVKVGEPDGVWGGLTAKERDALQGSSFIAVA
jgi:WhiB family redox-sensing transcriptional regulator